MHERFVHKDGLPICQNDVRFLPRYFNSFRTEKIPAEWVKGDDVEQIEPLPKKVVERHVIKSLYKSITGPNGVEYFNLATQSDACKFIQETPEFGMNATDLQLYYDLVILTIAGDDFEENLLIAVYGLCMRCPTMFEDEERCMQVHNIYAHNDHKLISMRRFGTAWTGNEANKALISAHPQTEDYAPSDETHQEF